MWLLPALGGFVQGLALFIVLSAAAEIIRLLKKLNGLPYGGNISEPTSGYSHYCSQCGGRIEAYILPPEECPHGKETFDKDDNAKPVIQTHE